MTIASYVNLDKKRERIGSGLWIEKEKKINEEVRNRIYSLRDISRRVISERLVVIDHLTGLQLFTFKITNQLHTAVFLFVCFFLLLSFLVCRHLFTWNSQVLTVITDRDIEFRGIRVWWLQILVSSLQISWSTF